MRKTMAAFALFVLAGFAFADESRNANWPQFRGPGASGIAEGHPLPMKWDLESGENVKWKTAIPGLAHSSPIIWGDKIFITTAVTPHADQFLKVGLYGESPVHEENVEHEFRVLCLNKNTGEIIWDQLAKRGIPKSQRHIKATQANSTPVTDGKQIIAFFGSEGMASFDMDGKMKWFKDFNIIDSGPPEAPDLHWGYASSPIIHKGKLIVLVAARSESFIAAYDVETGKGIWRTVRPDDPGWHTPTVHVDGDRAQVITNGYKYIGGYDLNSGTELWWMQGGGDVPVPTPVVAHDLIFITNAHGSMSPVYAIKTSATGDITMKDEAAGGRGGLPVEEESLVRRSEHIAWMHPRIGNYMQTPLVYGDLLYLCRDNGIIACYDARTSEKKYRERLSSGVGFTASPVAGDGKVYFTSEEGDVYVIKAGPQYEVLAKNSVGEIAMATPAVSEGTIFWRTKGHVIAIGEKSKDEKAPADAAAKPATEGDKGSH